MVSGARYPFRVFVTYSFYTFYSMYSGLANLEMSRHVVVPTKLCKFATKPGPDGSK